MCIAACTRKPRGIWSTVAHQFRKTPAVDYYAQPVDTTLLRYRVSTFDAGPFRSPVQLRGTLYPITFVIRQSSDSFRKLLKTQLFCELLNTLSAVEMHSALYKLTLKHGMQRHVVGLVASRAAIAVSGFANVTALTAYPQVYRCQCFEVYVFVRKVQCATNDFRHVV